MDSKLQLRKEISAVKRAFAGTEDASLAAICASARIMASPFMSSAATVLLYAALPDEVPTRGLVEAVLCSRTSDGRKRRVALPLVVGNELVLREYVPGRTVKGYAGIEEPSAQCPQISPEEIDLAVVPGVAFTIDGRRLGRGKGFYDRLLPSLKCHKIGLCFECQIVPDIPCDSWDVKMDEVIY